MTVRAKFKVQAIERTQSYNSDKEIQTIKMLPVTSGSEENKTFYAFTPSGEIKLGTINVDAANKFELGKEYYVDFTVAE